MRFLLWLIDRRLGRMETQVANTYSLIRYEHEQELRGLRLRLFRARTRLQRTLDVYKSPE